MGFVIHDDYWESMQSMPADLAKDFLYAITRYRFTGEEPGADELCYPFFLLVKKRLDLSGERSEAGRAGAAKANENRRKTRTHENAGGKTEVCRDNSCNGKTDVCRDNSCNGKTEVCRIDSGSAEVEVEDEVERENNPPIVPPSYDTRADKSFQNFHSRAIDAWNRETGQNVLAFSPEAVMRLQVIYLSGRTESDLVSVIRKKKRQWEGDPKMRRFIRPDTIFKRFETYLNEPDGEEAGDGKYADLPALRC